MSVSKETAHLPSYGRILYDKVSNSGLCSQVHTNTTVFLSHVCCKYGVC